MPTDESYMIKDARDRVKNNPDSHESQGLLGELLYQAGRYSEAIEPLQKAAEILQVEVDKKPDEIGMFPFDMAVKVLHSFYMMRGDSLLRLNQPKNAKSAFDRALLITSDDSDTWNLMGISQVGCKDSEGARRSFLRAVKLSPGRVDLWTNLQKCYRHLGRPEAREINAVLGSKMDIERNWGLLAELNLSSGYYDETLAIANQILQWNPDEIRGLISLARLRILEGSLADSVGYLKKILDIDMKNKDALWHLARVHCMLGNGRGCGQLLDRLLKIDPEHRNALALRSLLKATKPGAIQTFGVLSVEDETNTFADSPEIMDSQLFAYTVFPVLSLPLGATVEDAIHALTKGDVNRFTTDEHLKSVIVHMVFAKTGTEVMTEALSTKLWFFQEFQPGAFIVKFMERGSHRGINPVNDKNDLIESGDVILLTPPMSMIDDLRLVTYYPVIKSQTTKELANWSSRH